MSNILINSITCPITLEIFKDPVILSDGYTYEKKVAIQLIRDKAQSPLTRKILSDDVNNLTPNYIVKSLINSLQESNLLIKQNDTIIINDENNTINNSINDTINTINKASDVDDADDTINVNDSIIDDVLQNKIDIYYFFSKYGKNDKLVKKLIDSTNYLEKKYIRIERNHLNFLTIETIRNILNTSTTWPDFIKIKKLIHLICENSSLTMFKYILDKNVDLEFVDNDGNKLIHMMCKKFSLKSIKYLVAKGVDLESIDADGDKPIHIICKKKYLSIDLIKYFIDSGVDLESVDADGNKPIHLICKHRQMSIDLIKYFIDSGVDLESVDADGNKPIHLICKHKQISFNLIKYFIDLGIDLESPNNDGDNPIHLICKNNNSSFNLIKQVIDLGINLCVISSFNLESANNDGDKPIHLICKHKQTSLDLIKYFVDLDVDLESPNNDGDKPIHIICKHKQTSLDLIKYFVDLDVDMNYLNNKKQKPIHLILNNSNIFNINFDLLKYFIDKTNYLDSEDVDGFNPIYSIVSQCHRLGQLNNIKLCIVHKIKNETELYDFVSGLSTSNMNEFFTKYSNNNNLIKKIIDYHENFDKVYENEYQLIHYICKYCDTEVIKYMIKTKNININHFIEEEKINKNNFNYFYFYTHKLNKLSTILRNRNCRIIYF